MKNHNVKYYNGQFIDIDTNKRLVPIQGKQYAILAEDDAFGLEDVKLIVNKPLGTTDKLAQIKEEHGEYVIKLLDQGTKLFFRIGNSKKIDGDESQQYIFTCTIHEDLYMFKQKNKNGSDIKDWNLAECICSLDECIKGGLTLTEKVPALSLSQLFGYTVMFYFNMQRSSACNSFNTFFIFNNDYKISFEKAKANEYKSVGDIRASKIVVVKKLKNLFFK